MVRWLALFGCLSLAACDLDPPPRELFSCSGGGPCIDGGVLDTGVAPPPPPPDAGPTYGCEPRNSRRPEVQVTIVLDADRSMLQARNTEFECVYFSTLNENQRLNRLERAQAALIGCQEPSDGALDAWYGEQVSVSVVLYPGTADPQIIAFGTPHSQLEAQVLAASARQGGSVAGAVKAAAMEMGACFDEMNIDADSKRAIIVLTDASPASTSSTAYDFACDGALGDFADTNLESAADYLRRHDVYCSVTGQQPIPLYVIYVAPAFFDYEIAGGRAPFSVTADSAMGLRRALSDVMADVRSR